MKLTDCTKSDLIWVIKRMCQLDLSDRVLHIALRDLEFHLGQQRIEKAHQLLKKNSRMRPGDMLRSYGLMRGSRFRLFRWTR